MLNLGSSLRFTKAVVRPEQRLAYSMIRRKTSEHDSTRTN